MWLRSLTAIKRSSSVTPTMIGKSRKMIERSTSPGAMMPGSASTPSRLNMLEPTTLPTAMSCSPRRAAATEAASSGRLVPSATSVSPTTSSLTPRSRAIQIAPQTSTRDPAKRRTRPMENRTIALAVGSESGMSSSSKAPGCGSLYARDRSCGPASQSKRSRGTYPKSKTRPSTRLSSPSQRNAQATAMIRNRIGISRISSRE